VPGFRHPPDPAAVERLLLILDLDETLVHAREEPLEREPDFRFEGYSVYLRPFAREFVRRSAEEHRLAVWNSSGREYAQAIVGWLFDGVELEFLCRASAAPSASIPRRTGSTE
jgi:RNA polymerase II subunit A small phosphatase-like protein